MQHISREKASTKRQTQDSETTKHASTTRPEKANKEEGEREKKRRKEGESNEDDNTSYPQHTTATRGEQRTKRERERTMNTNEKLPPTAYMPVHKPTDNATYTPNMNAQSATYIRKNERRTTPPHAEGKNKSEPTAAASQSASLSQAPFYTSQHSPESHNRR